MAAGQAWALLAGAVALAVFLFLLKVRPRRVRIPSLLLWGRVLDDRRELTLWERIRRAVSLVITAAIALALMLAFLRPARAAGVGAADTSRGRVAIVLDSSWSMLARTRGGGTRWDRAIADARRLASGSSGGEIALATTADGLVEGPTNDLALIDAALDRLTPAGPGAAALPRIAGADSVYFITDGASARPRDDSVLVRSVFETAANAGITAFDIRPSLGGTAAGEAYLEIGNFGPAQKVHLTLERGGVAVLDRRFDMAGGEMLRQTVGLERGGDPAVRARVDAPANALAIDDEAFAWFDRARPLTVTVVSPQPAWLVRLFAGNPDVSTTFVTPGSYRPGQDDVVVFDRWAPATPPEQPALYFAPAADGSWLGSDTRVEPKPQWQTAGTHPVLRGVDPFTLTIERAHAYGSPELTPIAQSATGTPLVYVNRSASRQRMVVVTFGPQDSNLASVPALPVLAGNALAWLSHPTDSTARRAGLSSFEESVVRLTAPGGANVPLSRLPGETVAVLRAPGFYAVEGAGGRATFAVNVSDPDVSNLSRTSAGAAVSATIGRTAGQRPWWLYCAVVAFVAILAEWWTWLRRITV